RLANPERERAANPGELRRQQPRHVVCVQYGLLPGVHRVDVLVHGERLLPVLDVLVVGDLPVSPVVGRILARRGVGHRSLESGRPGGAGRLLKARRRPMRERPSASTSRGWAPPARRAKSARVATHIARGRRMRFSVSLPTDRMDRAGEFATQKAVAEIASAAEGAGFDACFVTDHPFPPDRWLHGGGHHAMDPFVALSFAAAATERLRVQTHILVLPYRNPFLAAKSALSLDVLSGGRLILGVAAGYQRGEFAALGADFDGREEVSDQAIRAMKAAWAADDVRFEGRGFHASGNSMGF